MAPLYVVLDGPEAGCGTFRELDFLLKEKERMAKLELALLAGDESKRFLADLTDKLETMEDLVSRLEKAVSGASKAQKTEAAPAEEEPEEAETADAEDDEDFSAKPKPKKKAGKTFDDEDGEEAEPEPQPEEKPAKKAKAKKLTPDDVNDACRARAKAWGKNGVQKVRDILEKKFSTKSVLELEESQYGEVIEAMKVEEE
jgi:hypothetical protein